MITELMSAFLLVFVAELGDKTQLLAMMFATRYRPILVLAGIVIGAAFNHGLAVLVGSKLGDMMPLSVLSAIAGFAFIYFAFSSLAEEDQMRGQVRKYRSTLSTVAIAFFVGELGDKTQLAAITLAMDAVYPWIILLGTVSAMLVISAIGIGIGTVIGKNMPERLIKMVSAILFFVFGSIKLITLFWDKIDVLFIVMEIVVITVPFIWTVNRYRYKDNKI